jgi:hypothetical protein
MTHRNAVGDTYQTGIILSPASVLVSLFRFAAACYVRQHPPAAPTTQ